MLGFDDVVVAIDRAAQIFSAQLFAPDWGLSGEIPALMADGLFAIADFHCRRAIEKVLAMRGARGRCYPLRSLV